MSSGEGRHSLYKPRSPDERHGWHADSGVRARWSWQLPSPGNRSCFVGKQHSRRLQGIVSREVPPGELAVVTVGALQAGSAENIISNVAVLKVNTRSVSEEWREVILSAIKRIVRAECAASNSPQEPEFEPTITTSALRNDAAVTAAIAENFRARFEDNFDPNMQTLSASEDFNNLAIPINKPYCFWFFGGHDPVNWKVQEEAGTLDSLPVNHSPFFAPIIHPTLETGTEAMVTAALTFLTVTKSN